MPPSYIFLAFYRLYIIKHKSIGAIEAKLISRRCKQSAPNQRKWSSQFASSYYCDRRDEKCDLELDGIRLLFSFHGVKRSFASPLIEMLHFLDSQAESSGQPVTRPDHRRRAHFTVGQPTALKHRPAEIRGPLFCQRHASELAGKTKQWWEKLCPQHHYTTSPHWWWYLIIHKVCLYGWTKFPAPWKWDLTLVWEWAPLWCHKCSVQVVDGTNCQVFVIFVSY